MEVIGGIKIETLEFKKEPDDNANIVEIEAEDIQEPEENDSKNIFKISEEIIQDEGNKKTYQDDIETMQNIPKIEKDKNEAIPTTPENLQEKLILNFVNDESQPKKKQIITKNNLRTKPVKIKPPIERSTTKSSHILTSETIYCEEYTQLKDKKYCCNYCKLITSMRYMKKHIRQIHKNKAIYRNKEKALKDIMETCRSRYVAWYEYTCEDDTSYRCSHCQELIQSQLQVERHILVKHRLLQRLKKCPLCSFQTSFYLNPHMLMKHTDEKNKKYFWCDKCEFKSVHKAGVRRHILSIHSGMTVTKCDQCQKVFKKEESLRYHIRRFHSAESLKKVKCFHCSYESLSKDALKNHIAVFHTKVEDLMILHCPHCAFNTRYRSRLNRHVSAAHRREPLQCHICSYQCSSKATMDMHLIGHQKEKNEKDLKYRCDHCDYKTHRQYSLQIHKLNHLKPEEIHYFHCYHCKFKAKRKDNLKTHVLRHFKQNEVNFECYMCNFKTKKRQVLLGHIDNHSKKTNEKNLTSEVSRLQHADEAPFGCYLCDFTTVKQHLLVRHIDNHLKEANKRKKLMPKVTTLVPVDELTKKRKLDPKEEIEEIEVSGKVKKLKRGVSRSRPVDQPFKMIPKKMTRSQTKKSGDSGLKNV